MSFDVPAAAPPSAAPRPRGAPPPCGPRGEHGRAAGKSSVDTFAILVGGIPDESSAGRMPAGDSRLSVGALTGRVSMLRRAPDDPDESSAGAGEADVTLVRAGVAVSPALAIAAAAQPLLDTVAGADVPPAPEAPGPVGQPAACLKSDGTSVEAGQVSLPPVTGGPPLTCALDEATEKVVRRPRGEAANVTPKEGVASGSVDTVARAAAARTEAGAANGHPRRPPEGGANPTAVTGKIAPAGVPEANATDVARQVAAGTVDDVNAPPIGAGRSVRRREGVPGASGRDRLPVRTDEGGREPGALWEASLQAAPSARAGRNEPVLAHVATPEPTHGLVAATTTGPMTNNPMTTDTAALATPGYVPARADQPAVNGATVHVHSAAQDGPGEVLPQIVKAMHLQWRDGGGDARIRLEPEHLGEIIVSLRVRDGAVTASLRAENPVVQGWIEGRQQELRSALAQHGLRLDWFDVAVTPDGRRDAHPDRNRQRRQGRPSRPFNGARFEIDV